MAYEEDQIAILEAARLDMEASVTVRKARYESEDAATAIKRAHEQTLYEAGVQVREDMKASLEARIAARGQTPEAISAELQERVRHLEASLEALTEKPAVTPAVTQPTA